MKPPRKAQSTVEYLILFTAVISVLVAFTTNTRKHITGVFSIGAKKLQDIDVNDRPKDHWVERQCLTCDGRCGTFSDGCGSSLDCGPCADGQFCNNASHTCQSCPVQADFCVGKCGPVFDGCQTVNCGGCLSPQTCGGGGVPNVCGCAPSCPVGACGNNVNNGCGGTMSCTCPGQFDVCVAGGCCTPNAVAFCNNDGIECGSIPDGKCGGPDVNCALVDPIKVCPADERCIGNICQPAKTCAADYPGQCGEFDDGWGGKINCACTGRFDVCQIPNGAVSGPCCTPNAVAFCNNDGIECGSIPDGKCGGPDVNCALVDPIKVCPADERCIGNICQPAKTCAADYPGQCGDFADGWGSTINCACEGQFDVCRPDKTCCKPITFICDSVQCGKVPNSCGGGAPPIDCEIAPFFSVCPNGSKCMDVDPSVIGDNVCCPLATCTGKCGTISDNCGGTIDCDDACVCGDGIITPAEGEECDDPDNLRDSEHLNGQTCRGLGYDGGVFPFLGCYPNLPIIAAAGMACKFNPDNCYKCNNGEIEGPEACDGTIFPWPDCVGYQSQNYHGGPLGCASNCTVIDTSQCWQCGNGRLEGKEVCEGVPPGLTCKSLEGTFGFKFGDVQCPAGSLDQGGCDWDYSGCYNCLTLGHSCRPGTGQTDKNCATCPSNCSCDVSQQSPDPAVWKTPTFGDRQCTKTQQGYLPGYCDQDTGSCVPPQPSPVLATCSRDCNIVGATGADVSQGTCIAPGTCRDGDLPGAGSDEFSVNCTVQCNFNRVCEPGEKQFGFEDRTCPDCP